jgi:hypothetical protein
MFGMSGVAGYLSGQRLEQLCPLHPNARLNNDRLMVGELSTRLNY